MRREQLLLELDVHPGDDAHDLADHDADDDDLAQAQVQTGLLSALIPADRLPAARRRSRSP